MGAVSMMKSRSTALEKLGQKAAAGSLALLVADVHMKADKDATKAIRMAREARHIFRKLGDKRLHADAALQIAIMEYERHSYEDALRVAREAQALFREVGSASDEAQVTQLIAHVYTATGEPERSPWRQESVALLETMVEAVQKKDSTALRQAHSNLKAK